MFSTFSLNKNKSKKIILIHGLFATSGYWLPYLSSLKDFNLIILNIDYIKFLKDPQKTLKKFTSELNKFEDVSIIIAHSLGTILIKYLNHNARYINICPVYKSTRTNKKSFITLIHKQTGLNTDLIENTLKNVDSIDLNKSIIFKKQKTLNFFPKKDKFFEYNIAHKNENIFFDGDHFDISDAFKNQRFQELLNDI